MYAPTMAVPASLSRRAIDNSPSSSSRQRLA